jgi:hypothetical protein
MRRPAPVPDEIIEAFRAVAPTVEAFARDHGILIDRYRRAKAAWELRFSRLDGGEAALVLSYRERTGHVLDVSVIWWLDDFEGRTRRLRSEKVAVYDRRADADRLRAQLEAALARVDAWTVDDLGPPHGPYVTWAREHTAASFTAERERLPQR